MEDEFSLREYLQILADRWLLVVVVTGLALLAATVVNLVLAPSYEAEMTLLVPKPIYDWRLQPLLPERADIRLDPRDAVVSLAQSRVVAAGVAGQLDRPEEEASALSRRVSVSKEEGQFVRLAARGSSPESAVVLANAWKDILVEQVTLHYSSQGSREALQSELSRLGERLAVLDAQHTAISAETGLGVFVGGSLVATDDMVYGAYPPSRQELALRISTLAVYRQAIDHSQRIIAQIDSGTAVDELPLALLDVALLRESGHITSAEIVAQAIGTQELRSLLLAEVRGLTGVEEDLSRGVDVVLAQLADDAEELHRVSREREEAEEVYLAVLRELTELDLRLEVEGVGIKVITEAKTADRPVRPNWRLSLMMAGGLGVVVGALVAFATAYFAASDTPDGDTCCSSQGS